MNLIHILIVDDHPVVREGLTGMLGGQPDFEVVGMAADGETGVAMHNKLSPDVTLMDLQMPGLDGVGAIEAIKTQQPSAHIIVLTTYDSDADILRAIEAGATGYLLKDTPPEELFRCDSYRCPWRFCAGSFSCYSPDVAHAGTRRRKSEYPRN
jgi:DNA-binding NarL/FixJ family response regulator